MLKNNFESFNFKSNLINKDIITTEHKKTINKIMSESRKAAKPIKCLHCKEEQTSFCNSHTIPAFCLRNIALNGKVYYSNKLIDIPLIPYEKGVNQSGTFQLICKKCDSTIFQEYENPDNYDSTDIPIGKMLAQIAMKNYLKAISKRLQELELPTTAAKQNVYFPSDYIEVQDKIKRIDLNEDTKEFERAKRLCKKSDNNEYEIIWYTKLDYVIPLTYQGTIALISDLNGDIINNVYLPDPTYRIASLHLCLFPLKKSSVILIFFDKRDKRYRSFKKQFLQQTYTEKLEIINYMLFLYTEDYFISKLVPEEVINDNMLQHISAQSTDILMDYPDNPISFACEKYNLSKRKNIPNLLSENNKLR